MSRLVAYSWPYGGDPESQARSFFAKLREGNGKGIRFPFSSNPHQIVLATSRSGTWFVAILVLTSSTSDDSVEIHQRLEQWFKQCDAGSYQDYESLNIVGQTIRRSLGEGYTIVDELRVAVQPKSAAPAAAPPPAVKVAPPVAAAQPMNKMKAIGGCLGTFVASWLFLGFIGWLVTTLFPKSYTVVASIIGVIALITVWNAFDSFMKILKRKGEPPPSPKNKPAPAKVVAPVAAKQAISAPPTATPPVAKVVAPVPAKQVISASPAATPPVAKVVAPVVAAQAISAPPTEIPPVEKVVPPVAAKQSNANAASRPNNKAGWLLAVLGLLLGYSAWMVIDLVTLGPGDNTVGAISALAVGALFFFIGRGIRPKAKSVAPPADTLAAAKVVAPVPAQQAISAPPTEIPPVAKVVAPVAVKQEVSAPPAETPPAAKVATPVAVKQAISAPPAAKVVAPVAAKQSNANAAARPNNKAGWLLAVLGLLLGYSAWMVIDLVTLGPGDNTVGAISALAVGALFFFIGRGIRPKAKPVAAAVTPVAAPVEAVPVPPAPPVAAVVTPVAAPVEAVAVPPAPPMAAVVTPVAAPVEAVPVKAEPVVAAAATETRQPRIKLPVLLAVGAGVVLLGVGVLIGVLIAGLTRPASPARPVVYLGPVPKATAVYLGPVATSARSVAPSPAKPAAAYAPIAPRILVPFCEQAIKDGVTKGTSYLCLESQPGDWVGSGKMQIISGPDSIFSSMFWWGNGGGGTIDIEGDSRWSLEFRAPEGMPLAPGLYENSIRAMSAVYTPNNGLDISGNGHGCNTVTGRFEILDIVQGTGNYVAAFAANFEQHCEGKTPALLGYIRLNSSIP